MGITVALHTAVSGLFANQQAIAATSENIANVNSPDFARREVSFVTDAIPNQFAGVSAEIVRSGSNRFLATSIFTSSADAAEASLTADVLSRIEASLGAPGENLSFADEFNAAFASFAELSASPSSTVARQSALAALGDALGAVNRTLDAIDSESAASVARAETQAVRANTLLEDIFNLNQIVADSPGAGDELDRRLRELSSLIDISVTRSDDDRVSVATSNGTLLADSASLRAIGVSAGATTTLTLASVDPATGVTTQLSADAGALFTGGEIGGLLSLVNTTLPNLRDRLASATRTISAEINTAQSANASVGQTGAAVDPLIVETNGSFAVNATLQANPDLLAIAQPAAGSAGGANDGSGAGAIGSLGSGAAMGDIASVVSEIGAAARTASDNAVSAQIFSDQIETRRLSENGVNLDEELSNLIVFQRAYNANARVIAAVDELYQSLLIIL